MFEGLKNGSPQSIQLLFSNQRCSVIVRSLTETSGEDEGLTLRDQDGRIESDPTRHAQRLASRVRAQSPLARQPSALGRQETPVAAAAGGPYGPQQFRLGESCQFGEGSTAKRAGELAVEPDIPALTQSLPPSHERVVATHNLCENIRQLF